MRKNSVVIWLSRSSELSEITFALSAFLEKALRAKVNLLCQVIQQSGQLRCDYQKAIRTEDTSVTVLTVG